MEYMMDYRLRKMGFLESVAYLKEFIEDIEKLERNSANRYKALKIVINEIHKNPNEVLDGTRGSYPIKISVDDKGKIKYKGASEK